MEQVPEKTVEVKCLVIGSDVGKTDLIKRVVRPEEPFDPNPHPTSDVYFVKGSIKRMPVEYLLHVGDIPSSQQKNWTVHAEDVDLILAVWDANNLHSFLNLILWLEKIKEKPALQNIPIVFIRNKVDLTSEKEITFELPYLQSWARTYGFQLVEVVNYSAKENIVRERLDDALVVGMNQAEVFMQQKKPRREILPKILAKKRVGDNPFAERLSKVRLLPHNDNHQNGAKLSTSLNDIVRDTERFDALSGYMQHFEYTHTDRQRRFANLTVSMEKLINKAIPPEEKKRTLVWLLLNLLSIGQRKKTNVRGSQVSEFIEMGLREFLWKGANFPEAFEHTILNKINTANFCETELSDVKIGSIVGEGRHRDMSLVLSLLRELDDLERAFFHTRNLEGRIATTLLLAERIFTKTPVSQEELLEGVDPKTLSANAHNIVASYFQPPKANIPAV